MDNTRNGEKQLPKTGLYDGPDDSSSLGRNIINIESLWNIDEEIKVGTVDDVLSRAIQAAIDRNEKVFELVDIGSGPTGEFLKDITLLNEKELPKTVQMLRAHPELQVLCTGLTDAESPDRFLQRNNVNPKKLITPVTAENVEYTLTAKQTLEKFLASLNIEKIDLALATFSLTYLGPKVFEQTMRTVIEKLSEGGTFIVAGYAEDHPGLERNEFGSTHLKIRNQDDDFPKMLDRRYLDKRLYSDIAEKPGQKISHQDLLSMISEIEEAEEYLERINLLSSDTTGKLKRKAQHYWNLLTIVAYYGTRNLKRLTTHQLRHDIINERHLKNVSAPIWAFQRKLRQAMREKKIQILKSLSTEFKDTIDMKHTDHMIIVQKKAFIQ